MIQRHPLEEADFRGERFAEHPLPLRGNNDLLVLTRPDIISGIHHDFLEAGADIIETNTFSATWVAQADYGTEDGGPRPQRRGGAAGARGGATSGPRRRPTSRASWPGRSGPTNRMLSISPDVEDPSKRAITFEELRAAYVEQVRGLVEGGADLLLVETIIDGLNAKAAIAAIERRGRGDRRPPAADDLGDDHRPQRAHARRPDDRGLLDHDRPRAAVQRRRQLRPRRGRDAALPGRPLARRLVLDQLLPQRRPAERLRRVRRGPRRDGRRAARVRLERPGQHHRRLLRHDPGPHPRDRRGRRGRGAAARSPRRSRSPASPGSSRWCCARTPTS